MSKTEQYRVSDYIPAPVPVSTPAGKPLKLGVLRCVTVSPRSVANSPSAVGLPATHIPGLVDGEASVDLHGAHALPVTVTGGPTTFGQQVYLTGGILVTAVTAGDEYGALVDYGTPNGVQVECIVKILN